MTNAEILTNAETNGEAFRCTACNALNSYYPSVQEVMAGIVRAHRRNWDTDTHCGTCGKYIDMGEV